MIVWEGQFKILPDVVHIHFYYLKLPIYQTKKQTNKYMNYTNFSSSVTQTQSLSQVCLYQLGNGVQATKKKAKIKIGLRPQFTQFTQFTHLRKSCNSWTVSPISVCKSVLEPFQYFKITFFFSFYDNTPIFGTRSWILFGSRSWKFFGPR